MNLELSESTKKLINGFIPVFTGQCLLLCVALKTSNHWSASVGRKHVVDKYYAHIYASHWTTPLSYVCQYHSKSMCGQSLSDYQSVTCHWINWWCWFQLTRMCTLSLSLSPEFVDIQSLNFSATIMPVLAGLKTTKLQNWIISWAVELIKCFYWYVSS